ncbi:MAG TPA: DUF2231 domain-containing protein [Archangium sp.]|uniref:DUF2231 domain-containing protein n=1 Tax=Archangium sp. TaxID=1872627 RepID=UPI002E2FDCE1|nr:DUF2231 domain-containing protein [Archangium sp.]HEX5747336.1 DUF2231 domain-containing protein [Archangium sp.]
MSNLPLHPALVHLPLGLAFILPLLALGLTLAALRGKWSPGGWAVVVALLLAVVGGGLASLQTGEREEERVERLVPESAIERHEELAEAFVWTSGAVLALALGALVLKKEGLRRGLAVGVTAGSLAMGVLAVLTGEAGGELVYRHGAASAYVSARPGAGPSSGAPVGSVDDD